jgi:DNA polymerase III epsilon subunit-like protein
LDSEKDHIVEVGAILYSTGMKRQLEAASWLVKTPNTITEEITGITGLTNAAVAKFGYASEDALDSLLWMAERADYWIGQNVIRFDKRFLEAWCKRHGKELKEKLWIDTRTDLPNTESKHLGYMAADKGFLNLFPHSALADCQTVLKLTEFYNFDEILERAKQQSVVVRSHQKFEDNELAKKLKFRWVSTLKVWAKDCKEGDITDLQAVAPFKVTIEKDIPLEAIWY